MLGRQTLGPTKRAVRVRLGSWSGHGDLELASRLGAGDHWRHIFHGPTMPDPSITQLEELLARVKQLGSLGVSLDGYERWGNGGDPEFESFARAEIAQRSEVVDSLRALASKLRATRPEVHAAWARAHLELLEDYLERVPDESTAAFVAKREMTEWRKVERGDLLHVEENPVHVEPDPELYGALFGVVPPKLHW